MAGARADFPSLNGSRPALLVVACLAVWAVMRAVFFVGLAGSDDLYLLRYSVLWDRVPANGWEARLLGNALTALSVRTLGFGELSAVLPSLAASLVVLVAVMCFCYRVSGAVAACWGGLLAAVLPIDVEMATSVSPHTLMTAWVALGTWALLSPKVPAIVPGVLFAVGVVTHFSGVYYVGLLCLAALIVDAKRYVRGVVLIVGCGLAAVLLDMAVFTVLYDDPFLRFRLSAGAISQIDPVGPLDANGAVDTGFFLWPFENLVFSKPFGIALGFVVLGGWVCYGRLSGPLRILLATTTLSWLWLGFGSAALWEYRPFERILRYLQPVTFAVAVLFGGIVAGFTANRAVQWGKYVLVVICGFNLMAGGSWDQSIHVSRELLAYAREHPGMRLVTDYRTWNEMYVLGGMKQRPNVFAAPGTPRWKLFDRSAVTSGCEAAATYDGILINPLNASRGAEFAAWAGNHAEETVYASEPVLRGICRLAPWMDSAAWCVKKPPARVTGSSPGTPVGAQGGSDGRGSPGYQGGVDGAGESR